MIEPTDNTKLISHYRPLCQTNIKDKQTVYWAGEVVVAQLAEQLLMIPEDPGSNPVISNFYLNIYLLLTVCRKDENKEKEAENGPFFLKKNSLLGCLLAVVKWSACSPTTLTFLL